MAAPIGALRVTLGANTAQFEAGMRRAQSSARRTGQSVERSFSQMRVRTVQAFGAIRIAAAGLGLGLGATFFADQAKQALEFAASLTETAQSIGLTVEQLQIFRRAVIDTGGSVEGGERAIAILNRTLGQARAGVPAAVQAFQALRIDPEQFTDAGQVLPAVMEKIRNLRTVSEQAAAAQRLMGRGAAEMIPLLVQGAEGWDRYAREARAAGLVTEEQARRADEAMDKIARLGVTIRTQLASAIADAIPELEAMAVKLYNVAAAAGAAIAALSRMTGIRIPSLAGLATLPFTLPHRIAGEIGRRTGLIPTPGQGQTVGGGTMIAEARRMADMAARARAQAGTTGDMDLDLSGGGGGGGRGGGGRSAADERKEHLRNEHEFQTEMRRFREEELRAQQDQITDSVARSQLDDQLLVIEREQYVADQELAVALGERTRVEADALIARRTAVDVERQSALELDRRREVEAENRDISDARHDIELDALRQQADLAETASERREIELRLLDLAYRYERAKLEELSTAEGLSRLEQERAQMALDALDARHAGEREGAIRGTRGPMEEWLASIPQTAAQVNEALENIAANGLQSISDGLADAIMMTRSWGDVFKNIANQIVGDLLRMGIQRSLGMVLGNAGGGQGVPGFLSGIFGAGGGIKAGGGKAKGGPVLPGYSYTVGENGPERLTMGASGGYVTPNRGGGRGMYFDLRGAVMTADLLQQMNAIGEVATGRGAVLGAASAQTSIARRQRARLP